MPEERRSQSLASAIIAGALIGVVEVVVAISLASVVFVGRIESHLVDGVGLYLAAAALTLAVFAWRAGARGVVGGLQHATAAVFAVVVTNIALSAYGSPDRAFVTAVAGTLVLTVLTGIVFQVLGTRRRGNLIRFVPVPVVGGFLAGLGWLLLKGGVGVAIDAPPTLSAVRPGEALSHWLPAFGFGLILLLAVRLVRRPVVVPIALAAGLVAFVIGTAVTGSGPNEVRAGGWLLGPFDQAARLWEPWTLRALSGADWWAVLGQWAGLVAAIFVASLAFLFKVGETEAVLGRDLDTNRELRDAGIVNVVSGAVGGIPGSPALSLTTLAARVNARTAGFVACLVPLAAAIVGASVVELIPRMIVGGVLAFLGLGLIVEWVWDRRRSLPTVEYVVVWVILAAVIVRGFLPGVVLGLVLAVVLFAISYGRIELVRVVEFGGGYRSNVDRPADDRARLRSLADRVEILRVHGFVFFGSASKLLDRVHTRAEAGGLRYLVIDLRQVTGLDASAVVAFGKVVELAQTGGFELVFTGASEGVRRHFERGGVVPSEVVVAFDPDLDRGLQRCEDALLAETLPEERPSGASEVLAGMPPGLSDHLERVELVEGDVLIRQDDPSEDVFVLESGRLQVELQTPDGQRMRLRGLSPGVVVGEVALYTGEARTADVVAETPSVVRRLRRASIERIAREDPRLAAALHRWLATTLATRLTDSERAVDMLLS